MGGCPPWVSFKAPWQICLRDAWRKGYLVCCPAPRWKVPASVRRQHPDRLPLTPQPPQKGRPPAPRPRSFPCPAAAKRKALRPDLLRPAGRTRRRPWLRVQGFERRRRPSPALKSRRQSHTYPARSSLLRSGRRALLRGALPSATNTQLSQPRPTPRPEAAAHAPAGRRLPERPLLPAFSISDLALASSRVHPVLPVPLCPGRVKSQVRASVACKPGSVPPPFLPSPAARKAQSCCGLRLDPRRLLAINTQQQRGQLEAGASRNLSAGEAHMGR